MLKEIDAIPARSKIIITKYMEGFFLKNRNLYKYF